MSRDRGDDVTCKGSLEYLENKKRVVDMMTTAHSIIRDRYNHINTALDCLEVVAAAIICGTTFLNYNELWPDYGNGIWLTMGFFSIFILILTILRQRLDLKTKAEKHDHAARVCSKIKLDISYKMQEWCDQDIVPEEAVEFVKLEYEGLEDIVPIPDRKFTKLKHMHDRKVQFSRFLDSNRMSPWIVCKIRFFFIKKR